MKYRAIDLLEGFKCLGSECKKTCCRGWQILLDEECADAYKSLKGLRGRFYKNRITLKSDPPAIKKILLRCPFHTSDGLCLHQLCGQEELMPMVCKNFPRRAVEYTEEDLCEVTMELSCPAAIKLFMDNLGRRKFVEYPLEIQSFWVIDNEDGDFFEFLKGERDFILDKVWEDRELYRIFEDLYPYVYAQHQALSMDRLPESKEVEFTSDKEKQGKFAVYGDRGYAFFPIQTIDKMLTGCVDFNYLFMREPRFYRYIRRYIKLFSKMTLDGANRFFHENVCKMIEAHSHLALKYKSYFSYVIQEEFLTSYESYSMIRELTLAMVYTQVGMLFDLIEYLDGGVLRRDKEEHIIYMVEHNIRHNPTLTNALYSVIREEFL